MTTKNVAIKKGSWLSDVIKEIPTNTILNKVMTGCGATTLEINAARHSIIIEPNVPVIIGKKAQHAFLFAVYEGTTREDVKAYLSGEEDGYRKIITTPEGFDKKVLPAMYELGLPLYEDYFLLFDECEKPVQDVGYRGDIYLPVEDFFKFKGKAMVSATPIIPSDPRFEEQGFEMIRIVPTYDYCMVAGIALPGTGTQRAGRGGNRRTRLPLVGTNIQRTGNLHGWRDTENCRGIVNRSHYI